MSKMRQFGTVRTLKSGRYQARYFDLGKQVAAPATFKTKADANAWLSEVETDIRRGEHIDPRAGSERFGDYARQWIDQRGLRPRTKDTYESQLKWILPTFGEVRLSDISPLAVRSWYGGLRKSSLATNTVAKVYRLFRTIMTSAVEDDLLRTNPVSIKGAAREEIHELPLPTYDEVSRIAEAIEPRFRALVWVGATSGLRYGELTGLARRHIDLDRAQIRVERSLTFEKHSGPVLGAPKTKSAYRTVALPAATTEILRLHIEEYVDSDPDALVFRSVKGSPLLNRYFAPYWKRAKAAAGVDSALRFHDLRHLASTTAASSGASLKELMARMGHATSEASLRYLGTSQGRDTEIAAAMDIRIAASSK